jgi:phage gpG-like protein
MSAQDLQRMERGLSALFKEMADLSPIYDELLDIGLESILHNFDTGGRYGTGILGGGTQTWKPSHRVQTEGGKTLLDNGQLRDSIKGRREGRTLVWGTSWKSAKAHNEGMRITPKAGRFLIFRLGTEMIFAQFVDIPKRPFLVLQNEDIDEFLRVIKEYEEAVLGRTL